MVWGREIQAKQQTIKSNRIRCKQKLIRLIDSNKEQERSNHSFLTLTYKKDQRDISKAQREFAKFIQRLNYLVYQEKGARLKYVAVIEFQDQTRQGVIHFHILLFNVPYIEFQKLSDKWGFGYIKINQAKVKTVKGYMAKYIVKGFNDPRLTGKKKYFGSINLSRPQTIREPNHVDKIRESLPPPLLYKSTHYDSSFLGNTVIYVYEQVPVDLIRMLIEENPPPRYFDNESW